MTEKEQVGMSGVWDSGTTELRVSGEEREWERESCVEVKRKVKGKAGSGEGEWVEFVKHGVGGRGIKLDGRGGREI